MSDGTRIQTVTLAGEEYVVVPRAEYDALRSAAHEELADATILAQVLEDPDEEWVPADVVRRIAEGENPIRVWRRYRGMKAGDLASARPGGRIVSVSNREREKSRVRSAP